MNELNLDDPATWPHDTASIEALAASSSGADPRPGLVETEPAEATDDPAPAGEPAAPEPENAAARVLTADGKHTIPYEELRTARDRARELEARTKDLEAALAQARQAPAAAAAPQGQAEPAAPTLADQYQALYDRWNEVKSEDAELAEALRGSLIALHGQLELQAQVQEMRATLDGQRRASQQSQAQEVQGAIDANPVLAELMADPVWSARLVGTEQALASDPQSRYAQAADWPGRLAIVLETAQAIYGPAPAAAKVQPLTAAPPAVKPAPKTPAALPVPPSLSALSGGVAMTPAEDDLAQLEQMSPGQMSAHLRKLAEAGKLTDLIYRVS